jgi:predicted anti-sigma-YlaC factor YlaD
MSERATSPVRVARLPLNVALKWSVAVSVVATVLVVALLWTQMAAGRDPALGPKLASRTRSAAAQAAPTDQVTIIPVAPAPQVASAPAPVPVQTTTS